MFSVNYIPYDDSLGFHGINDSIDFNALETVRWQTVKNFTNDTVEKNIMAFSSIAKMAEENKVKLIIITMPVHKSFYELSDKAQMKFTENVIHAILAGHSNCIYLDYYADFMDDSCYCDATHLNAIGADFFTKKLINDLYSIGIFEK